MAKDPAFLFFPGDWLGGTQTLTRLHKGAYMDLLMAQFNNGHMTLQDVQFILGEKDFSDLWPKLKTKFKVDDSGLYFNQKLENEVLKRKKFSESRHKNLTSTKSHKEPHMASHMENGDGNRNENESINGKVFGKSENLSSKKSLIDNMHDLWKTSFPHYTEDIGSDYPACREIAEFIFRTAGVKDGFGNTDAEIKVLNTFQAVADQVSKDKFWANKSLKSISKHIQEFYNKLKNPGNGTGSGKIKSVSGASTREALNEALNKRHGAIK